VREGTRPDDRSRPPPLAPLPEPETLVPPRDSRDIDSELEGYVGACSSGCCGDGESAGREGCANGAP
jgi:hypothetical protein